MKYGATVVTWTSLLRSCSSILMESDQPVAPHLLAEYTDILGFESIPPADVMLHICPLLRLSMSGSAARATSIGATVFMLMVLIISSVST